MKLIRIPVSKVLFLLYALMFLFIPDFALHEGKGFEIERPEKKDRAEPKNVIEAKEKLEEARKQEKHIAEELERLEEEKEKAYDKALGLKQAALAEGKEAFGEEYEDAKAEYAKKASMSFRAGIALWEWQNIQKNILAAFKTELAAGYEPVYREQIKEPSWWPKIVTRVQAWIAERRIDFNEFLGDKQKVVELRQDLVDLHTQLGKEGFLPKARNLKELANNFDAIGAKIGKNLEALNYFISAQKRGELTDAQKEEMKAEVKDLLVDLALLKDELRREKEIDKNAGDIIEQKIDEAIQKTFKDLNIDESEQDEIDAQYEKMKKQEQTIDERYKTVVTQLEKVEKDIGKVIRQDPFNFKESSVFKQFSETINRLENFDKTAMNPLEHLEIQIQARDAYNAISSTLFEEINNPKNSSKETALVHEWIAFQEEYGKKLRDDHEAYNIYLASEGREPLAGEIGVQPPVPKDYAQKVKNSLQPQIDIIDSSLDKPTVDGFVRAIENLESSLKSFVDERLAVSAVNEESLLTQQAIINDILEPLLDIFRKRFTTDEKFAQREYIKAFAELAQRSAQLQQQHKIDQSILTVIEEGFKVKFELVTAHKRPASEKQYLDDLASMQKKTETSPPATDKQKVLRGVKFSPLEENPLANMNLDSQIGKQFVDVLGKALTEPASTTSPVIPPQIPGD